MHHSTDRIIHTTAFVTPVVEHWLEREIVQWKSSYRFNAKYVMLYVDLELWDTQGICILDANIATFKM